MYLVYCVVGLLCLICCCASCVSNFTAVLCSVFLSMGVVFDILFEWHCFLASNYIGIVLCHVVLRSFVVLCCLCIISLLFPALVCVLL